MIAIRNLPLLDISDTRRPEQVPLLRHATDPRSTRGQDAALGRAAAAHARIEADPYNVLVLNYTMKCPLACDFCCYACHPGRRETMSLELALNVVDQAAELGVFKQAGFTGGEPLLFLDEILTIARRLQSYELPYSMISSCHWADSERVTQRTIESLAESGLAVLSISHDPSHGKWVDPSNVRRAVRVVTGLGIPAVVCASFYSREESLSTVFPEMVGNPMVELVDRVVLPVGSSKQRGLSPATYGLDQDVYGFACYKRIYHDITVFWDGEVYPCCSVYNRSTKGLSLGNAYEKSLAEIWDSVEGSLMYRVMKGQGFARLYEIVQESDPELFAQLPEMGESLGPCHLCHNIFSKPELSSGIRSVFDRRERDAIAAILDAMSEVTSSETMSQTLSSLLNPSYR